MSGLLNIVLICALKGLMVPVGILYQARLHCVLHCFFFMNGKGNRWLKQVQLAS